MLCSVCLLGGHLVNFTHCRMLGVVTHWLICLTSSVSPTAVARLFRCSTAVAAWLPTSMSTCIRRVASVEYCCGGATTRAGASLCWSVECCGLLARNCLRSILCMPLFFVHYVLCVSGLTASTAYHLPPRSTRSKLLPRCMAA
jgi:hypothetical protein